MRALDVALHPSPSLERVLRCFVPHLIEERVHAGMGGMWVSEHRKLVSVFMKVVGLGRRPCEVADLMTCHEAVKIVQESVKKFDGTITRLICDDKGTRFLISWGLPGHATDNDEQFAVLACLEILDGLKRIKPVLPPPSPPPTRKLGDGGTASPEGGGEAAAAGGAATADGATAAAADGADAASAGGGGGGGEAAGDLGSGRRASRSPSASRPAASSAARPGPTHGASTPCRAPASTSPRG